MQIMKKNIVFRGSKCYLFTSEAWRSAALNGTRSVWNAEPFIEKELTVSGLMIRIDSMIDQLADAEQRVARYVLEHSDRVPFQTVQEVSQAADVSVASVSRLARKVGCQNFKSFKIELAQESATSVTALYEGIATHDSDEEIVRKIFGGNIQSLQDTLQITAFADLSRAAQAISEARRLVFFGVGGSATVAHDSALRFSQLGLHGEAYGDSYRMLVHASQLDRRDVAVGVSHSGRTAATVQSLQLARDGGAMTIGIANYHNSSISKASEIFFQTSFREARVKAVALSSLMAQICLIDAIYLLTARKIKELPDAERLNEITEKRVRMPE